MNLLDKMREKKGFTATEIIAIDYLLENIQNINELTINRISKATYTSNSTIIRICRKLGFEGFKSFKIALIIELENNKYTRNNVDMNLPFYESEGMDEIINHLSSLYKDTIDLVNARLDIRILEKVVHCILNSNRLFIYAVGDSQITAKSFINKMIKINIHPLLATDNREELVVSNNIDKNDSALFISYSGNDKLYEKCIKIIKRKGVKIISLTAMENSILAKNSNFVLTIIPEEHNQNIARFYSQLAIEYILSIIYSGVFVKNYKKNHHHKNSLYES